MPKPIKHLTDNPRVVVLGGGFGGMTFCRKFRGEAEVVLIDRQNHHLFQPLLYQVATAALSVPDVTAPLRSVFRDRKNVETIMGEVTAVDLPERVVHLEYMSVPYTYLVIALGGKVSYFGHEEWARHAPGLKSVDEAMRIRRTILTSFERAETTDDDAERKRLMTMVVVGGGPTGVEMAGALAELTKQIFRQDFRRIDPTHARIILVDGGDRLLTPYPEKLSASAKHQLESLGVECRLNTRVQNVDAHGVDLNDDTRIDAENLVWGGGLIASPVMKTLQGVELTRANQAKVQPDLSLPGHPQAFAVGDCISLTDANGKHVPGLAPAAMQEGKYLAKLIEHELKHHRAQPKDREPFTYTDKGTMATIGRKKAVADIGPFEFSGLFAWLAWLGVHLMFLIGFRNRFAVLMEWFYAYVTFHAGARIIYNPTGVESDPEMSDAAAEEPPPEDAADAEEPPPEDAADADGANKGSSNPE